jgi:Patatin-like phospholipase
MTFDRSSPSLPEINKWFIDYPLVPPNTFELALVLGGTVSAGAYTAGALDFLIEALDSWTEQRENDTAIPQHNVVLRVITGTSGGGVIAAIAARAFNFDFPSIRRSTPVSAQATGNPFYDVWIKTLTLDRFLKTDDIKDELVSVLNGSAIDEAAKSIVQFQGRGPKQRAWLAEPLRIILTLTNLYGIPYKLAFDQDLSETFVDHADYIKYAVVYPGQAVPALFRPDELTLGFDGASLPQATTWDDFSKFARATAAFPVGFPPRALVRPTAHYRYRVVARTPCGGTPDPSQPLFDVLTPDWDALAPKNGDVPEAYAFLAVDGGATDNEPIQLGRTALCGLLGTNPRGADDASRAVVLIDPFAGQANLGPQRLVPFTTILGGVGNALLEQTRYDSSDLLLAADSDVFSRFMLTPQNGKFTGGNAIASAGLNAFIGFACSDFMRYDYLLGRKNCRDFLGKTLVLSDKNPVFGQPWTADQKAKFAQDAAPGFQPVIPLVGSAAEKQELDAWPKGKLDPEVYRTAIKARFRAIADVETSGQKLRSILGWLGAESFQYPVADFVIGLMKASLSSANLD